MAFMTIGPYFDIQLNMHKNYISIPSWPFATLGSSWHSSRHSGGGEVWGEIFRLDVQLVLATVC